MRPAGAANYHLDRLLLRKWDDLHLFALPLMTLLQRGVYPAYIYHVWNIDPTRRVLASVGNEYRENLLSLLSEVMCGKLNRGYLSKLLVNVLSVFLGVG